MKQEGNRKKEEQKKYREMKIQGNEQLLPKKKKIKKKIKRNKC